MPERYFILRPQVIHGLEWTGSNFSEFESYALAINPALPITDNMNGTVTIGGNYSHSWTYSPGDFITLTGAFPGLSFDVVQEVFSPESIVYGVARD